MLSRFVEDYIKNIYKLQEHGERVSTTALAHRLGVSAASTTNMIKKLTEMGLVQYQPYRGARLTPVGEKVALEIIRHHRLLELYLTEVVGMSWDKVHAEADALEHVISEELEELMDRKLGRPQLDPHGDPIPTKDLEVPAPQRGLVRLPEAAGGSTVVVARILETTPELLRYLAGIGLKPGAVVKVVEAAALQGLVTIRHRGKDHPLSAEVAGKIQVVPRRSASRARSSPSP